MRCFLGLELPRPIQSALVLQQFLLPVKRRVPPENFHVTLVFLGEVDNAQLDTLDQDLARLTSAPLTLQIAGLGLYGGAKAHNLHARLTPAPALMALQTKLERIVRQAGITIEKRRYDPHVTLAYLRAGAEDQPALERAVAHSASFRTAPFELAEITLFRSHLRSDGAVHDVLERYALSA